MSLSEKQWLLIYNEFKKNIYEIEFPSVLKHNPYYKVSHGYASPDNCDFLSPYLKRPGPNADYFLTDEEFKNYEFLFNSKARSLGCHNWLEIVDYSKSVNWNIQGLNTMRMHQHNLSVDNYLRKHGALVTPQEVIDEFILNIENIFTEVYIKLTGNSPEQDPRSSDYILHLFVISNKHGRETVSRALRQRVNTSNKYVGNGELTPRNCLKALRRFKMNEC